MTVYSDVRDKVILITGANAGIGRETALELAQAGAHIYMACRSRERSEPVRDAIIAETSNSKVELIDLDLGSFDSVRACAEDFLEKSDHLDILINNAGLAGAQGTTSDGFEIHFGVNHLGHFLLTHLLLPSMVEVEGARVVNVASRAHIREHTIDFEAVQKPTQSKTGFPEYCVSKLANVVYSMKLAEVLEPTSVNTYAVHPGVVASNVWRRLPRPIEALVKWFMISSEEGAQTTLYCATSAEVADDSGLYYDECAVKETADHATTELAEECWKRSLEWTGIEPGAYLARA